VSPKDKPSKPLDCYVRVSRVNEREGDSFLSPDLQERRCRAIAEAHSYSVGKVLIDLDESGGKASRPAFDEGFARIRSGESGGLIVAKLDRFGRRVKHVLEGIAEIEKDGGAFVCVEPAIDTSTPTGRFVLTVFAALAEMELDRLTEGWQVSQAAAIARGAYIGPTPTGYSRADDGTLRKVEGDCEMIANAYHVRVAGGSWSEVARALDGLVTLRNAGTSRAGLWTHGAARKLVMSAIYKGLVKSGEHEKHVAGYAVVSPSEWAAAQPRKDAPRGRQDSGGALLAKLLRCGCCGRTLTLASEVRKGKGYAAYRCGNSGSTCQEKARFEARMGERLVVEVAFSKIAAEEGGFDTGEELNVERKAELEQAVADAKDRRRSAAQALDPSDEQDQEVLDGLVAEVEEAEGALADYLAEAGVRTLDPEYARGLFETGEVADRRDLLRTVLSHVIVNGKRQSHDATGAGWLEFHFADGSVLGPSVESP
jgi:site-specific DNA recombinase